MKYEFHVTSELYVAGKTEEGYDHVAEGFFVVAEAPDGTCYSKGFFPSSKEVTVDDLSWFVDITEQAEAEAEALRLASLDDDPEKDEGWNFWRFVYGSSAYTRYA